MIDFYSKIAKSKHLRSIRRKRRLKLRKINHGSVINYSKYRARKPHYGDNINYLASKVLLKRNKCTSSRLQVPSIFSLIANPKESFEFLYLLFSTLYHDSVEKLELDYDTCESIDLDAQVFMDVILKDYVVYLKKCNSIGFKTRIKEIVPINYAKEDIKKILFSIGSFKILKGVNINYPDIIPYHLCIGNKKSGGNPRQIASQKEIHTTQLIEYVIKSLDRLGQRLTPDTLSDLCQVVGEVLINAEEHSTTSRRYSIGYFEACNDDHRDYGIFNLVIFNFGQTIYEKFKDTNCPTKHIVKRMQQLSEKYTNKDWFKKAEFEEETLWTLYSLQDGVTSKDNYKKRGNGSIRFIESFMNLKGIGLFKDNVSCMNIISGNSRIIFDGTYLTHEVVKSDGNKYKVITFNSTGSIEDKPNEKFVNFAEEFFPGTMIVAKILIEDNDLIRK